jgi:hypothetical protein
MIKYSLFVILAMTMDVITFTIFSPLLLTGEVVELNPIMALGYSQYGISIVLLLKIACTVAIISLVAMVERPRLKLGTACLGIAFGLLGTFGNVSSAILAGGI